MQVLLGTLSAEQVLRFYELRNQLMERVLRLSAGGPWTGGPGGLPARSRVWR